MNRRQAAIVLVCALSGVAALATSAGPAAGEVGRVIFRDSFAKPSSGWFVGEDRISKTQYRDGAYWVTIKKGQPDESAEIGHDLSTVRELTASIDVTLTRGRIGDEVGVVCYSNIDADSGYILAIDPGGGTSAIAKRSPGPNPAQELAQKYTPIAVRRVGRLNHLSASCSGTGPGRPESLTLSVNGKAVLHTLDKRGLAPFRGIGVFVYSNAGGAVAVFDNAVAASP